MEPPVAPVRPLRRLPPWAGWVLSMALLGAAAFALRDRWAAVGEAGGLPGLAPSLLAVGLYIAANAVLVAAWRAVVVVTGSTIPFAAAAWVWAVSQLARYTLGAAQVGGRALVGRRYGLTATTGAVTALVEVGWQASITAALVLGTSPWWLPGAEGLTWLAWVGVAPVLVLVWGQAHPAGLLRALSRALDWGPAQRLTGGRLRAAAERVCLDRAAAARVTGWFLLNTGLRLAAFLLLFAALGGSVADDGALAVGAYAVGQLVGRLAVFAPGGIGPREGATALAVAPAIGGGPALVLVAATRLLEILGELAFLGLARAGKPSAVADA